MEASASPHSVQDITSPAAVEQTMGAYLPTVTYTTAAKFQKQGCKAG